MSLALTKISVVNHLASSLWFLLPHFLFEHVQRHGMLPTSCLKRHFGDINRKKNLIMHYVLYPFTCEINIFKMWEALISSWRNKFWEVCSINFVFIKVIWWFHHSKYKLSDYITIYYCCHSILIWTLPSLFSENKLKSKTSNLVRITITKFCLDFWSFKF